MSGRKSGVNHLRSALALVFALNAPSRLCWSNVDGGTLETMIKGNKLGPMSEAEKRQSLEKLLSDKVDLTLSQSKTAHAAAGLAYLMVEAGRSPFDGNQAMPMGRIRVSREETRGVRVDDKGQAIAQAKVVSEVSEQEERTREEAKGEIVVGGECGGPPGAAINALQDLVKFKVEGGETEDFFLFLYALFFLDKRRGDLPGFTSGKTVDQNAIATFHNGSPGLMTFDCKKYTGLPPTLQRKIACHEFYHKFNFQGGEPPAYAIMSRC